MFYPLPTHFSDGETEAPKRTKFSWAELRLKLMCLHVCFESTLLFVILFVPSVSPCGSRAGTILQTGRLRFSQGNQGLRYLLRRKRGPLAAQSQGALGKVRSRRASSLYGIFTIFLPLSYTHPAGPKVNHRLP